MQELNVKQSGIKGRVFNIVHRKMRSGRILKRVHELYLRDDISCGLISCRKCTPVEGQSLEDITLQISHSVTSNHALLVDSATLIRFHHLFENSEFRNIIITQTVWEDVKKSSPPAYKAMYNLCYESPRRNTYVFMDDLHYETHISNVAGECEEERLTRSLLSCAHYYQKHWDGFTITPVIICGSDAAKERFKQGFDNVCTLQEYVEGMKNNTDMLDKIAAYLSEAGKQGRVIFPEHLSHKNIQNGLGSGKYRKATFQVSRENYTEAYVHVEEGVTWFIQGRVNSNRAVNGDIVAVELLPEDEWTCPQKIIKLRDVEELEQKEKVEKEQEDDDDADNNKEVASENTQIEQKLPTARVVGIVKRNWRQYCGMILQPAVKDTTRVLFAAAERLIPRIRIETRQAERLIGKRVIVSIDGWPRDSRYPVGHYVRTVGAVGDRDTENKVLLLEHDVPHSPFSEAVYACLPKEPWSVPEESHRRDLRSLTICSVDPPGCTDIDDALHCTQIATDRYEVGVHIADVTHFVRPNTALDDEAAYRGTTVYLCDRRIDMLPELLSSDLCSLREGVDRLAFSVIWTLTADADIIDVKFCKSIIRSSGALTYEMAQNRIDDASMCDPVTNGLRGLLALSKKLKAKRHARGALTLASSEIRFTIDSETRDPLSVEEKRLLDTNSMVEEFMLLANISVAEKISAEFPDCALLRRHPVPSEESYTPIVEMARAKGYRMNVGSGKTLAESLDEAVDPNNPMLNTLFRMLTTRCMTQALYFSSGSLPFEQYVHFGLAAPIYTHFTSPIRRYADIMVHRLLAASINADTTFPNMLKGDLVTKQANNLNYRHKQAQYAGRASVVLNTQFYFKKRTEDHDGYVMGIRKNGIQVFVPAYGLESVVVFPPNTKYEVSDDLLIAEGVKVRSFERVRVRISLNESDVQHIRLDVKLVSPAIAGFSVDYVLSAPEE